MLTFSEQGHEYRGADGSTGWISVTTLLFSYEPEKDWEKILQRTAKRRKVDVEELRVKWNKAKEYGCDRGSNYHKLREDDVNSCEEINGLPVYRSSFSNDGLKYAPPQKLEQGIYTEPLLYLLSAKVCGQADLVEITEDGYINIKDYKTNKEIKQNGYFDWEGEEECFLQPLADVPNCNYWKYVLQLNLYAYIIKRNNPKLKIGKLILLHTKLDENEEIEEIVPYDCPLVQDKIKLLIEHYKQNRLKAA